jgi:hypothetical protein
MKHLAAYLLLGLGGNTSPSAEDVKAVLESVGVEADSERLDKLISELEGKDINEVHKKRIHNESQNNTNTIRSSSLRVPKSLHPCHLVVPVVVLPQPLLLAVPLLPLTRLPLRRRRRRPRRSLTTTWASVFSTKRIAWRIMKHEDLDDKHSKTSIYPGKRRTPCVDAGCEVQDFLV